MKLASRCGNDEGLAPYGLKPLVQSALGAECAIRTAHRAVCGNDGAKRRKR